MKKNYENSASYQLNQKEECVALTKALLQALGQLFKDTSITIIESAIIQKAIVAIKILCVIVATSYTLVIFILMTNYVALFLGGSAGTSMVTLIEMAKTGLYFMPIVGPIAFFNLKKTF